MQKSNWGLLHCRWILYQLSYQGSPASYQKDPKSPLDLAVVGSEDLPFLGDCSLEMTLTGNWGL